MKNMKKDAKSRPTYKKPVIKSESLEIAALASACNKKSGGVKTSGQQMCSTKVC